MSEHPFECLFQNNLQSNDIIPEDTLAKIHLRLVDTSGLNFWLLELTAQNNKAKAHYFLKMPCPFGEIRANIKKSEDKEVKFCFQKKIIQNNFGDVLLFADRDLGEMQDNEHASWLYQWNSFLPYTATHEKTEADPCWQLGKNWVTPSIEIWQKITGLPQSGKPIQNLQTAAEIINLKIISTENYGRYWSSTGDAFASFQYFSANNAGVDITTKDKLMHVRCLLQP